LHLHNNKIKYIPTKICQLVNLKQLQLHSNKIKNLPNEINQLVNLNQLYIQNNKIGRIPLNEIQKLKNLVELLCDNQKN